MALLLACGGGAALAAVAAPLAAPMLQLNASRGLTVCWDTTATSDHYEVEMTVSRGGAHVSQERRFVPADAHSLAWPEPPDGAESCFRVGSVTNGSAVVYSKPTCYSVCSAITSAAEPHVPPAAISDPPPPSASPHPPPPPPSPSLSPPPPPISGGGGSGECTSCFSCTLFGVVLGVVLSMGASVHLVRRGGLDACPKPVPSLARSLIGSAYSGLSTAEPAMELNPAGGSAPTADFHCANISTATSSRGGGGGVHTIGGRDGAPSLHPPPDINASDFELRWSTCATRSHALTAALPTRTPPSIADDVESALVSRGFFCVAAGSVGDLHKLYFAGELSGSADWLMLELVLHWHLMTVQATFRCDDVGRLHPLVDDTAQTLAQLLRTSFGPPAY